MKTVIKTIKNYPDDGNHQECHTGLPFTIRKGEDGYYYNDEDGVEQKYNMDRYTIDKRWIVQLTPTANQSLKQIFEIKVDEDMDTLVEYCVKLYKKSMLMEIERMKKELNKLNG